MPLPARSGVNFVDLNPYIPEACGEAPVGLGGCELPWVGLDLVDGGYPGILERDLGMAGVHTRLRRRWTNKGIRELRFGARF